MRHLILGCGSLGVAGLTLISLFLNYDFSMKIGGQMFALGSVGIDLFKIALPVIAVIACTAVGHGWLVRGFLALCALALWVPVTVFSLQSAGGAALLNRMDSTGNRTGVIEKRKGLDAERVRILGKNPWSAQIEKWKALPSAAIAAEMAGYKTSWMWEASNHCEKAEGSKTRGYCQIFHTMDAARQVALEAEADNIRLTVIERELAKTPVLVESDPVSKAVSDLTKIDPKWVVYAWASLLAFLLEFVPNIGPAILMLAYKLSKAGDRPSKVRLPPDGPNGAGLSKLARDPAPLDKPEKLGEIPRHGKIVDFGRYRLDRPDAVCLPGPSKPLSRADREVVLAAARKLGSGQHSLDKIMSAVKQAAREKGVKPPHRNHTGPILSAHGHKHCGRRWVGGARITIYNLTEHGLSGVANL